MTYVVIGFVLLMIVAPIIAILPNARQKAQMAKRRQAMANGISVELTNIADPDPDPKKYLTSTGKPLPRRKSVIAYRIQRKRPLNWRQSISTDWGVDRLFGQESQFPEGDYDEPVVGWRWNVSPDIGIANDLGEFMRENLVTLPGDVARVEEKKHVISVYWNEEHEVRQVIDFIKGCALIVMENPESDVDDSDNILD